VNRILYRTGTLEPAGFVARPNRFIVEYRRGRRNGKAYLANSGRLGEILLPGTEILLERRPGTSMGMEAVGARWSSRWPGDAPRLVFLNASRMNDVAEALLRHKLIPELARAKIVRREFRYRNSRIDFLLERAGRPYLLEVKSVTLAEHGIAFFPDAITARGRRHLEELAGREPGFDAGVLFLVQGNARHFLPDFHNDLEYAKTYRAVRNRLDILAYAANPELTAGGELVFRGTPSRLETPDGPLARATQDSGLYVVSMRLPARRRLDVGLLGNLTLEPGYYLYAGSARRALSRRIARHLRLRKRFHYHIDYLRAVCDDVRAFPIRASDLTECGLAREVERISSGCIERFGSSDCRCRSHLFHFPQFPPIFQQVLTWGRTRISF
jgi:sugar fermentation stimulation protein A